MLIKSLLLQSKANVHAWLRDFGLEYATLAQVIAAGNILESHLESLPTGTIAVYVAENYSGRHKRERYDSLDDSSFTCLPDSNTEALISCFREDTLIMLLVATASGQGIGLWELLPEEFLPADMLTIA